MNYVLLSVSAVVLFIVSATLNISGYTQLFPKSVIVVSIVLAGLELAKFTIVGVVFNLGDLVSKKLKVILSLFIVVLIFISTVGHYAVLTSYYVKSYQNKDILVKDTKYLDNQIVYIKEQIKDLKAIYQDYPKGHSTKRLIAYKKVKPDIDRLQKELNELQKQKYQTIKETNNEDKKNTNIFQASADLLGINANKLASLIIFILSLIIDPMTLLMVYTAGAVKKNIEKRKEQQRLKEEELKQKELENKQIEEDLHLFRKLTEARDYNVNNTTIDDIVEFNDDEVIDFFPHLDTKEKQEWFKLALVWREYGFMNDKDILTIDFDKIRDLDIDNIYDKYKDMYLSKSKEIEEKKIE